MRLSTYRTIFKASTILVVGLAFIFPSRMMAKVTHKTVSCPAGTAKQLPNDGGWGCTIPLPVGQPGHGGGVKPSDWGMCGILNLSAEYGPKTVAEIIVQPNGYYAVRLAGNLPKYIPTLTETCVLFSDFHDVPPVSDATASGTPPDGFVFDGIKHPGGGTTISTSRRNACIWAGLHGNLTTYVSVDQGEFGWAYAKFDTPATNLSAQHVETYAFCNSYTPASWNGWNYVIPNASLTSPTHVTKLGLNDTDDWCYMGGIQVNLTSGGLIPKVSAGLGLTGGDYSVSASPAGYIAITYNCLPLKQ